MLSRALGDPGPAPRIVPGYSRDTAAVLHRANLAFRVLSGGWRLRVALVVGQLPRGGVRSTAGTQA